MAESMLARLQGDDREECLSCGEGMPRKECAPSKRECGHHCNCSWIHDCCHWCGAIFGEEGAVIGRLPEKEIHTYG